MTQYDLQCHSLTKTFAQFTAVDDVSFSIPRGSFFSILGPSGCGKTTLMRMIAGFESPSAGDIEIKGRSVLSLPPNKRNVKMVFQHLALFPMMNVAENIAYGLRCIGADKREITQRVGDALERVGLPDAGNKEVNQLSGGQKQRIAIARCMVLDPDVLLLDEPLGALDLKLREHMKIELKQLQAQFNTTFVYITHDQSEALVMSDHVAVMNNGRFEQIGEPEALYHEPATAFVAGFVGDSNQWHGKVSAIDNNKQVQVITDNGLTLFARQAGKQTLRRGQKTAIFVRPEAISISRIGSEESEFSDQQVNKLQARVETRLFNGANSRILARSNSGQLIEVDLPQRGSHTGLQINDEICLTWAQSQSLCFAND